MIGARMRFVLALAVIVMWARPASAADYQAPLLRQAPHLNGKIEAAEWAGSVQIEGFAWQGALERRSATGYVGATPTHFYLGIRSQLPARGELLAAVARDSENLVYDDAVEVWIDPAPGQAKGSRYQLLLNSAGHRWYRQHGYGGVPDDVTWRGDWQIAQSQHDGWWDVEIAVPLKSLAPGRAVTDGAWGINLCRDWKQDWAWSSSAGGEYAAADRFTFSAGPAPQVRLEEGGDPFSGHLDPALHVLNPASRPVQVKAELDLQRDRMPELSDRQTLNIAPGQTKVVSLHVADDATHKFTLSARVSADGGVIHERTVSWTAAPPWQWVTASRETPPLDLQFAYYPYLNRLKLVADASHLTTQPRQLTAVIRDSKGAAVRTVGFDRLSQGRQEITVPLPPLRGRYQIVLKTVGPESTQVVRSFERTVFPWEHNHLGETTRVYPPFTPINVTAKVVSTVLRRHVMNDAGLWDQVVARGAPLLAAPMRWQAVVDRRPARVVSQSLRFLHVAGNQVVAEAPLSFGGASGRVQLTWDYDGTMRTDLTLAPSPHRIDSLDLVVPLRASQATFYHAMGDGIRNTLYDRTPAGQGVIFTSQKVQSSDLPAGFCTYIYVGTPIRGLCWFAENDRGWSRTPGTPNLELIRRGAEVDLHVYLLNQPTIIHQPRTITFGLLAAPVKPRLSASWRYRYRRDRYQLLGTDINWLALGDAASLYPAGKDLYLWQMIARGNQEHLSQADIDSVIERGRHYFEPYGPEAVATFIAHVRYNLTSHFGGKMIFYYNRASYQAAEEFQTFQDEWSLTDTRTVGPGNSRTEIKIVPSESYIDHALYWYGKSFDIGRNQGVYWDNWFFIGDYNTAMTGAYRDASGKVVPSTGIWGLRELSKRTFQYMNERRMLPITMPHMTSTAILPLLSFATVQYDWEWKYSEGDVQDRFTRPYILMVSDGELAGTWPVLLNDHGAQADDPWIGRTFAAVAMLHELDCPYPTWTQTGQQQLALFRPVDSILAHPGVQAYRYWDDRPQPVITDRADLPTIVYSVKGQEAVFAVVSYANADAEAHVIIDPVALGFTRRFRVFDAETGTPSPLDGHQLRLSLKKHDVRVYRIIPAGN